MLFEVRFQVIVYLFERLPVLGVLLDFHWHFHRGGPPITIPLLLGQVLHLEERFELEGASFDREDRDIDANRPLVDVMAQFVLVDI